MGRSANRTNTDAVMDAMLDLGETAFTGWTCQEDVAEATGLRLQQVHGAFSHLHLEYGACRVQPTTRVRLGNGWTRTRHGRVQLDLDGVVRYLAVDRNYHPDCLGESERERAMRGEAVAR